MENRLFLKHLFRSIGNRPIQPLLLILVLTLAVAVCTSSINLYYYLVENQDNENKLGLGNAEYLLSTNSLCDSRFIIEDEVEGVLPENCEVCGLLGMQLFWGEEHDFVYGCATRFDRIDSFFDLSFDSVVPIKEEDLCRSVLISRSFAQENNISLQQTIKLSFFDMSSDFVVCGILSDTFLSSYSVIIDKNAVTSTIYDLIPAVNYLGKDLSLVSAVYVMANGQNELVEKTLRESFPSLTLTDQTKVTNDSFRALEVIILVIVLICFLFSIVIIYCCFYILSTRREEETILLRNVGATSKKLRLCSSFELFLYWIVGSVLGFMLADRICSVLVSVGNLVHYDSDLRLSSILLGVGCAFVSSQLSLLLFVIVEKSKKKRSIKNHVSIKKEKKRERGSNIVVLISLLIAIGLIVACALVPSEEKVYYGCASLPFFALCLFMSGRQTLTYYAKRKKNKGMSIPSAYAVKNASRIESLKNTAGLTGISFLLAFAIVLMILVGETGINTFETLLQGDYLVLNTTIQADSFEEKDSVNYATSVYKEEVILANSDNQHVDLLALTDINALSPKLHLDRLPTGNEVFIPGIIAQSYGYEIGDHVLVNVGDKTFDFVYTESIKTNITIFLVNAEDNGLPYSMVLIDGKDDVSKEALYDDILLSLQYQSAMIIEKEDLIGEWVTSIQQMLLCVKLLSFFCLAFALIGMLNSIVSGYRSRRDELNCYRFAGMGKRDISKMIFKEIRTTFFVGFLLFLLFVSIVVFLIYEICLTFDMNIFWNLFGAQL